MPAVGISTSIPIGAPLRVQSSKWGVSGSPAALSSPQKRVALISEGFPNSGFFCIRPDMLNSRISAARIFSKVASLGPA